MDNNANPIVVEQTLNAPVAVVWKAITDKHQMRQWFFETMVDFAAEPGFETRFNVRCEERDYPHVWRITEVIPEKRITYDWRYDGFPGSSTVTWELTGTANGTKLTLTHEGIETFPQGNPVFSRESTRGGWDFFICESLKAFLERQSS